MKSVVSMTIGWYVDFSVGLLFTALTFVPNGEERLADLIAKVLLPFKNECISIKYFRQRCLFFNTHFE